MSLLKYIHFFIRNKFLFTLKARRLAEAPVITRQGVALLHARAAELPLG